MSVESQAPQKYLVAFATGWGSEFGGINVFNTEFLQHLSFACQGKLSVVCVVPGAPPEKVEHARTRGVTLVPLPYDPATSTLDASHARPAIEALKRENLLPDPPWLVWLGHDRITGGVALEARNVVGGRAALIHHMSYAHYESYAESATSASTKSALQKSLFAQADVLFGIGPLLRDALQDMLPGRPVTSLVPGLDEIEVQPARRTFTAFMSGRLSADAAKIKQGHLGVAAFADAHKRASADPGLPDALKNQPRLILRGADLEPQIRTSAQPDTTDWSRFAETYAGRVVNIQPLPYSTERKALLEELASATVALMPSWHEGFGLAGWEAVAAGVPLVVSEKSGLYQLLQEESKGAWVNWVYAVDVLGKVDEPYFREEDLKAVSDRLLEIAKDPAAARDKAARLREALLSRFSWKQCVDSALASLDWPMSQVEALTVSPSSAAPLARIAPPPAPDETSPLELPQPLWQPGSGLADSQLLRAEEAAVQFDVAREPELSTLLRWADDPEYSQALRLITGSGGAGKTRLALELCGRLSSQGWHCGFLPSEIGRTQVPGAWATLASRHKPLLVVFDYAETRQDALIAFLKAMLQTNHRPRLRILLLARDGGEWWDRLPARDPVCEAFLSGYATSGPFALPPMHAGLEQREAAYKAAVKAYADRMGVEEVPHLGVDLKGEHFERPLYIQMAALLALHGERPASAEGLTKALLHHERRYWTRLLQDASGVAGLTGLDDRHAAELMTLATLAGGFTRPADAQQVWHAWTASAGAELKAFHQRTLFERLAPLYPGQQGLQPLRPDLLGEALVAHALLQSDSTSLLDALLGPSTHSIQRQNALIVVARLSKHRPDIETAVVESLARNLVPCASDLVNVCTQSESRLPEWAEKAFIRLATPVRHQATGLLMPLMQNESVQLAELACAVSHTEVERRKRKLDQKPWDEKLQDSYAWALLRHAINLSRAGRDALGTACLSVDIYEKLATKNPNRFEAGWAASLTNYATHLSDYGHYVEALKRARKAQQIYEKLAIKDPARYEADWAAASGNFANTLAENGEYDEALSYARKELQIYEKLAAKNPKRFEPRWAAALNNHAHHLANNGQYADALDYAHKSLEIREKLASNNADRFEPDWAISMGNYAALLSQTGRYADALAFYQKALNICKKLTDKNAGRFEPDWVTYLHSYASGLASMGQYTEALTYARRALEATERLAAKQPRRFGQIGYTVLLFVRFLEWLTDVVVAEYVSSGPELDSVWCKPHEIPVLKILRTWVNACYAGEDGARASAFREILFTAAALNLAQFKQIEDLWLCACAWCASNAPDLAPESGWQSLWLQQRQHYLEDRGGRFPVWMDEIARRMGFEWPKFRNTRFEAH